MKLLLDQGLPRSTGTLLRAQGIDTVHVGDVEMWAAEDVEILSLTWVAWEDGSVVTPLDLLQRGKGSPPACRFSPEPTQ